MANASEEFRSVMSQHAAPQESRDAVEAGFKSLAASREPVPPVDPPPEQPVPEGDDAPVEPETTTPTPEPAAEEVPAAAEVMEAEPTEDMVAMPDGTQIPVSSLVKGYMQEGDYTRKTQDLAETRRQFDTERQQASANATQAMQHVQGLAQRLQQEMAQMQPSAEQMAKLRQQDPAEWNARSEEYRQRQELLNMANTEAQRLQQEQLAIVVPQQRHLLAERVDVFNKNFDAEYKALGDYATSDEGGRLSREEWDQLVDHRHVTLVWKAQQYDKAARSAPRLPKKLPSNTPKVLRPGVQRDTRDTVTEGFAAALARQRDSGGDARSTADAFRAKEALRRR